MEYCIACGEIIPEGRQICYNCENGYYPKKTAESQKGRCRTILKILILTDDIVGWASKIAQSCIIRNHKKTQKRCWIETDLFVFELISSVNYSQRGDWYSCAIIDKPIPLEIECQIILPAVKNPVIRTSKYLST